MGWQIWTLASLKCGDGLRLHVTLMLHFHVASWVLVAAELGCEVHDSWQYVSIACLRL